ncbi:type I-E CRISPR-associated protein Cas6/Cse3/CasE [Thioalkalivibrio thiocyanodenitrificans]|uniref:type I-E CRISPR-associated protein Cas6/Cse3/CasE n=1 Tax=Thioalkalivibrio thiocyanodenitrificans TaxID=243063 RepID=UPI00037DC005|nr:type I-E CRISPR-associated protein Cas6/Cse3/CasE [Thioalkalivibrio thiocyanodenitrificans]
MSMSHLVRLPLNPQALLRFAVSHGVTQGDEGFGYSLHLLLTTLFGEHAPKPFRFFERKGEVLGYSVVSHEQLLEHAQAFAPPEAWAALQADGVVSKPMPGRWTVGQRLQVEVLACPVERRGAEEKDAFLRALDRADDVAPKRGEVYQDWFLRRWEGALDFELIELRGMRARQSMQRRIHDGTKRLATIERPSVLFVAQASISDPQRFSELLMRGIGRHRTFGFGMALVSPPA